MVSVVESLALLLVRLPFAVLSRLLSPLVRRRYGPPEARVRAFWIEATSTTGPRSEARYYLVTGSDVDGPFDEIVAGLEQGKLVQPAGAQSREQIQPVIQRSSLRLSARPAKEASRPRFTERLGAATSLPPRSPLASPHGLRTRPRGLPRDRAPRREDISV